MDSQSHLVVDPQERDAVLAGLVDEIASHSWFGSEPSERLWLRQYLKNLYDRGLVYGDKLASVGMAAAKHRRRATPFDDSRRRQGTFMPDDISVMRSVFDLANQTPRYHRDSEEARALARRIIHLFRNGCDDPAKALAIIAAMRINPADLVEGQRRGRRHQERG